MLSKYSWLFFLTSKHCQEGLKVQQRRPTKHNPFPPSSWANSPPRSCSVHLLKSDSNGKGCFSRGDARPPPPTPSQGPEARVGDTQSEGGSAPSPRRSVILFFAKGKNSYAIPTTCFSQKQCLCDRSVSAEPAPSISQAQGAGRTEARVSQPGHYGHLSEAHLWCGDCPVHFRVLSSHPHFTVTNKNASSCGLSKTSPSEDPLPQVSAGCKGTESRPALPGGQEAQRTSAAP